NTGGNGSGRATSPDGDMPVIEASGTPRQIGEIVGEATREGIRAHLELFPPPTHTKQWRQRRDTLLTTLFHIAPQSLEELQATAEAAGVDLDPLLYLNCEPQYGYVESD